MKFLLEINKNLLIFLIDLNKNYKNLMIMINLVLMVKEFRLRFLVTIKLQMMDTG